MCSWLTTRLVSSGLLPSAARTHSAGFPPHGQVKSPCPKPVLPASSLSTPNPATVNL